MEAVTAVRVVGIVGCSPVMSNVRIAKASVCAAGEASGISTGMLKSRVWIIKPSDCSVWLQLM